jgi:MFS family permease
VIHFFGKSGSHVGPRCGLDNRECVARPTWKKHLFFLILVYGTFLVGAVGPLVAANQVRIAGQFHASVGGFAKVYSAWFVFTLGFSTIFLQVASIKFGKRPVYLATSTLLMVMTIWASYAPTFTQFTVARIFMGIGAAPLEFLVGASINDIYFVHERGLPMAIWNLALVNGINITPPIAGQILGNPDLGYKWAFRIFAIATGVLIVLQFFFMPETTFHRQPPTHAITEQTEDKAEQADRLEEGSNLPMIPRKSFMAELKPHNGLYKTRHGVLSLFLRPFMMLFTPIVFHGGLIYGLSITFLVVDAVSISVVFGRPPYSFSAQSIGLTYMGPFILAALAMVAAGPLTNYSARLLSRKNNGIYEPEFKLTPIIFYFIFGIMGFVGYGWTLYLGSRWIIPVVFFAFSNAGVVFGSTASISYVVDSHRHAADAALGALILWKNLWSFGLTWNLVGLIAEYDTKNVFGIIGVMIAVCCFLTIPMYIYGKRIRAWLAQQSWLAFNEEEESLVE